MPGNMADEEEPMETETTLTANDGDSKSEKADPESSAAGRCHNIPWYEYPAVSCKLFAKNSTSTIRHVLRVMRLPL